MEAWRPRSSMDRAFGFYPKGCRFKSCWPVLLAYAKRSLTGALDGSRRCPTTPTSRATCAPTSRPRWSIAWGTCCPSIPCAASSWPRSSPTTWSTPWARPSSRGWWPSRGPSPADVVRGYRIARDVTGAEQRWADVEQLPASIVTRSGGCWRTSTGSSRATARWYLENAHGADLGSAIATGREGFGRLPALLPELGSESRREAPRRAATAVVEQGVPEEMAHARMAYLTALAHAPDVISAAGAVGTQRSRTSGRPSSLLEDRARNRWIEEQDSTPCP